MITFRLDSKLKIMHVIRAKNNPKGNFEYYKTLNDIFTICEKKDVEKIEDRFKTVWTPISLD